MQRVFHKLRSGSCLAPDASVNDGFCSGEYFSCLEVFFPVLQVNNLVGAGSTSSSYAKLS